MMRFTALLMAAMMPWWADPPEVVRWLECIECSHGELKAVAALGPPAVPLLRAYLLNGPTADQRAMFRTQATYLRLVVSGDTSTAAARQRVDQQLDAFQRRYRRRAALALGAIGGPSAIAVLNTASHMQLPPDVARAVAQALQDASS